MTRVITDCGQNENLNPSINNLGIDKHGSPLNKDTGEPRKANLEELRNKLVNARESEKKGTIRRDMQQKIDRYIDLHKYFKDIESRMERLRSEIEPYLEDKGISEVYGTNEGKILLVEQNRPEINSRYTSYSLDRLSSVLDSKVLSQCTATVVDRYLLENLALRGVIKQEVVDEMKDTRRTVSFTVKKH